MKIKFLSSLYLLFSLASCNLAHAQIATLEESSRVELNQQLRYGERRVDTLEQFNDAHALSGWNIGGTTATGELIINDANDYADGLGSQGTSGQFLKSAGAGLNPTWASVTHVQLFTSSDTFTAPVGITKVYLSMVSGGGGGGGGTSGNTGAGGGGGGGISILNYVFTVVAGNNYTVTIGPGGSAGSPSVAGGTGGTTSFDSLSIIGGGGGSPGVTTIGGNGGLGANSTSGVDNNDASSSISSVGTPGGKGFIRGGNGAKGGSDSAGGGGGGGTNFGAGGAGGNDQGGTAATPNTGAGGGGGGGSSNNGGAGGSGICIVMY